MKPQKYAYLGPEAYSLALPRSATSGQAAAAYEHTSDRNIM